MTLVVDRAAVDAAVMRRREIRRTAFGGWIGTRLALALAAFYAVAFLVKLVMDAPAFRDMTGWTLTLFFGVPAFMACVVTVVAEQLSFSAAALDVDRVASRIGREVAQLTGPHWPLRTLRAGVALALCIGVVLFGLGQLSDRPSLLTRGSDQAIAVLVAGTLLVSILVMFAMRAATLFMYRNLLVESTAVTAPAPASPGSETSLPHPSGSGSG